MTLFELLGKILIDNEDANRRLDETGNKGKETGSKLGKAFSAMGKGAVAVGKTIGTGLLAGGTAMVGLTTKAVNLAGELEQNMGGSEAVFGAYAAKMQATAKDAFSNMGLSTSDYLATANKMGALFQGAGFTMRESMDLSTGAMQRAADVASIMGIDTESAMEAIAGAAKGNFTMMDNLGVAMNDTALQAYALEKGIKKSTSEMTQQEKIGLAMEMFMDKTAYAAGNYAKENETLAGSLGTAKAALTNFLDGSGSVDGLVNAFSNAASVIVDNVSTIAPRLVTGITDLINRVMPMIPPLVGQMLPVIVDGAMALLNGLVAALPSMVAMLVPILIEMMYSITDMITETILPALIEIIGVLVAALPEMLPTIIECLIDVMMALMAYLPDIIQPLIDNLPTILMTISNELLSNLPRLVSGVWELMVALAAALPELIAVLWDTIVSICSTWWGAIEEWAAPLIEAVATWWDGVKTSAIEWWETIKTSISEKWEEIKTAIGDAIEALKTSISEKWELIKTNTLTVFNAVKTFVWNIWNGLKTSVVNVVTGLWTSITNVWNNIKTTTSNIFNGVKTAIEGVWNQITYKVNYAVLQVKTKVTNIFNAIKTTVTNVWEGIKSAIQNPIETARDLVSDAIEAIKGFFDFDFSWPELKLPHFSFSGSWNPFDWPDQFPSIGIEWYAKAMNNPMLMNDPTIFGYNPATGNLLGGGEAGTEVVAGAGALMSMIGSAVAANSNAQSEAIINVLTAILDAITGGNRELTDAVMAGHKIVINNREFGRTVKAYA